MRTWVALVELAASNCTEAVAQAGECACSVQRAFLDAPTETHHSSSSGKLRFFSNSFPSLVCMPGRWLKDRGGCNTASILPLVLASSAGTVFVQSAACSVIVCNQQNGCLQVEILQLRPQLHKKRRIETTYFARLQMSAWRWCCYMPG